MVRCERTLDYARAINIACNRDVKEGAKVRRADRAAKFPSCSRVFRWPGGTLSLSSLSGANSPTVVNLSKAALIYRRPFSPATGY